jgi:hypothetical protein
MARMTDIHDLMFLFLSDDEWRMEEWPTDDNVAEWISSTSPDGMKA